MKTRFWSTYQPITAECNTSENYFGDILDARVLSSVRALALRAGIFEQDKILLFGFSTLQFLGRTKIIISWWAFGSQPSAAIARVLDKNAEFWQTRNNRKLPKLKLSQNAMGLFTWRWGTPGRWGNMWQVTPPSCKRDQIKMRDYVDRRVTHQSGLPHLPGVPHPHVNRP